MKNITRRICRVMKVTTIALASILLLMAAFNVGITTYERYSHPPLGKLVDVDGGKIHVYIRGNGKDVVVLMPGLGTCSPVYEFMPLVEALEKNYTVCVVEPFGYGWSSQTNTVRTNAKIIDELRKALKEAKVEPPYTLVPHSISGIYALYYANTFPSEVKAVVGLDISYPGRVKVDQTLQNSSVRWYSIARETGIMRLTLALKPSLLGYDTTDYSEDDLKALAMFTCWNAQNKIMANEKAARYNNYSEMEFMKFPVNIPVQMVLSKENTEAFKEDIPVVDWFEEHVKLVSNNVDGTVTMLEGGHYIHRGNAERIAEIIADAIH